MKLSTTSMRPRRTRGRMTLAAGSVAGQRRIEVRRAPFTLAKQSAASHATGASARPDGSVLVLWHALPWF